MFAGHNLAVRVFETAASRDVNGFCQQFNKHFQIIIDQIDLVMNTKQTVFKYSCMTLKSSNRSFLDEKDQYKNFWRSRMISLK